MKVAVGSFDSPASTGNQDVTVSGIGSDSPTALVVWSQRKSTGFLGNLECMLGMVAGSNQACISLSASSSQPTVALRCHEDSKAIFGLQESGDTFWAGTITFASGKFTVNWTTTVPGLKLHYMAVVCDDAELVQIQSPASIGLQTYNMVGSWTPDAILAMSAFTSLNATNTSHLLHSLGVANASGQRVISGAVEDGISPSDNYKRNGGNLLHGHDATDGSTDFQADLDSLLAGQVKVDWTTTVASGRYGWILCLGGLQAHVGTFAGKTETTGNLVVSGVGFTPKGYLLFGAGDSSLDDFSRQVGGADGSNDVALHNWSEDNISSDPWGKGYSDEAKCLLAGPMSSSTPEVRASHDSFSSDGFTLTYSHVDSTARTVSMLVLGDPPGEEMHVAGSAASSMNGDLVADGMSALSGDASASMMGGVIVPAAVAAFTGTAAVAANPSSIESGALSLAISAELEGTAVPGVVGRWNGSVAANLHAMPTVSLDAVGGMSGSMAMAGAADQVKVGSLFTGFILGVGWVGSAIPGGVLDAPFSAAWSADADVDLGGATDWSATAELGEAGESIRSGAASWSISAAASMSALLVPDGVLGLTGSGSVSLAANISASGSVAIACSATWLAIGVQERVGVMSLIVSAAVDQAGNFDAGGAVAPIGTAAVGFGGARVRPTGAAMAVSVSMAGTADVTKGAIVGLVAAASVASVGIATIPGVASLACAATWGIPAVAGGLGSGGGGGAGGGVPGTVITGPSWSPLHGPNSSFKELE